MKKAVVFSAGIILLIMANALFAQEAAQVGVVSYQEGTCDITHIEQSPFSAREQEPVYAGDRLRTKSYSKLEITFNDKSVVKAAPGTCLTIAEYSINNDKTRQGARIQLTRGKIETIVSKTKTSDTFVIDTPNAKGSVKGSDVFVSYQAGKTNVLVNSGTILVSNFSLPKDVIEVTGGDSTTVSFNEAPTQVRPFFNTEQKLFRRDVERSLIKKFTTAEGAVNINGKLVEVIGDVSILKKGTTEWKKAVKGDIVSEGDNLKTDKDATAVVCLDNGNMIYCQSGTELGVETLNYDQNNFESSNGSLKFVVGGGVAQQSTGQVATVQVRTPTAVCGVRGTVMYVNTQEGSTRSFFEGGDGFMTSTISGETADIVAGQNATIDVSGVISAPVYTSNEQREGLDQTWVMPVVDNYATKTESSPINTGPIIQPMQFSDATQKDPMKMLIKPFNVFTYGDVINQNPPPPPPPPPIYSINLVKNPAGSNPAFTTANMFLDLFSDHTFKADVNGTWTPGMPANWTLVFENLPAQSSNNDDVSVFNGNQWSDNSDGPWNADVSGVVLGTYPDKSLSGTASGTYTGSGGPPDTFQGIAEGTWNDI
ncbi:MAG: FecR domain-containing protein [Candidatus Omnitrophota bacterium]